MDLLSDKAMGSARTLRGRPDPPKCNPETRVAVNDNLVAQIAAATVCVFVWLHGGAGAGKSAVAETLSQICEERFLLIGCFYPINLS